MTLAARGQARALLPALALLAVLLVAAATRPLLPIDETRYAAVAWEMWQRGDLLLPVINGQPYAHKPPLLFWLIHAGWAVFGVNAWWPRCIAPLFAAGTLGLVVLLGRHLWPARPAVARTAPFVLVTSVLYAWFSTALMFDVVLGFFVTLGWLGLVVAWRVPKSATGFLLLALGLTGALYAKGPAALVHLLPPAVFAPWWMRRHHPRWGRWAGGMVLALLASAVLMLAWAVPAGLAGGPEYRDAIFWGQTAGRMADSFAHAAPWYTYLLALPAILAPWFLWPRWWQGLRSAVPGDAGLRFVLLTALSALVVFSMVSGKRLHYLLPEFVLFALLVARALDVAPPATRRALWVPAATLALAGVAALAWVPVLAHRWDPEADVRWLRAAGGVMLAAAAFLAWRPAADALADVRRIAVATTLSLAVLMAAVGQLLSESHDVSDVAARLSRWQREGRLVAAQGEPQGQWTLAGRLTQPLARVEREEALAWLARHPRSRAIVFYRQGSELPAGAQVAYSQRYRGGWLAVLAPAGEKLVRD